MLRLVTPDVARPVASLTVEVVGTRRGWRLNPGHGQCRKFPYWTCSRCKCAINRRIGVCRKCATDRVNERAVQVERMKDGVVQEIDYRDCALAQRFSRNGRLYGSEPAHRSFATGRLRK